MTLRALHDIAGDRAVEMDGGWPTSALQPASRRAPIDGGLIGRESKPNAAISAFPGRTIVGGAMLVPSSPRHRPNLRGGRGESRGSGGGLRPVLGRRLFSHRARLSLPVGSLRVVGGITAGGACTAIAACGSRNFGLTLRHQLGGDPLRQGPERLPCVGLLHPRMMEHGHGQAVAKEW